eukprot:CAMPEP_0184490838 /NCGR_PEP_ID=MMETSP0113_2-20130426/19032_1 /TAXON_ID=91329 /ORGANISM="Norrisiella sphaerica, Strain BC52" /LENGTH=242 /DNA_ID=CAMNT_0026874947 /DNA_START=181 /DNA_END=912 /DNA_ORIENTATION=-
MLVGGERQPVAKSDKKWSPLDAHVLAFYRKVRAEEGKRRKKEDMPSKVSKPKSAMRNHRRLTRISAHLSSGNGHPGSNPQSSTTYSAYDPATWWPTPTLKAWHQVVQAKTNWALAKAKLRSILHQDVLFHPPTYFEAREGRQIAMFILRNVAEIFHDFKYLRCFADPAGRNAVLEFSASVPPLEEGDETLEVEGVDILTMEGPDGKITDFKVMVRPPEAALLLKKHMDARVRAFMKKLSSQS